MQNNKLSKSYSSLRSTVLVNFKLIAGEGIYFFLDRSSNSLEQNLPLCLKQMKLCYRQWNKWDYSIFFPCGEIFHIICCTVLLSVNEPLTFCLLYMCHYCSPDQFFHSHRWKEDMLASCRMDICTHWKTALNCVSNKIYEWAKPVFLKQDFFPHFQKVYSCIKADIFSKETFLMCITKRKINLF